MKLLEYLLIHKVLQELPESLRMLSRLWLITYKPFASARMQLVIFSEFAVLKW